MGDYIKRKDALSKLFRDNDWICNVRRVYEAIEAIPHEDVVPVVHARWDEHYGKCSNCGCQPYTDCGSDPVDFGYRYCPYCGAEMEMQEAW